MCLESVAILVLGHGDLMPHVLSSMGGIPRGALNFFFGVCVPRGFQKVGSRERIFLEKWGSWDRKFGKFGSRELEFWPKHD